LEMRRHVEALQAYAPGARTATEASCRLPGGLDPATSERPSLINTVPMSRRAGWRRAMAVWRAVSARARWERTASSTIFPNAYQLTSMTLLRAGLRCPRACHLPCADRWVVVRGRGFSSGVSNIGHFNVRRGVSELARVAASLARWGASRREAFLDLARASAG